MTPSNPYDIDAWTNPYTPRPPFRYLPWPVAWFFGYRHPGSKPQPPPHTLTLWAFCFLGAFLGVSLLEGVYLNLPRLDGHKVPIIIASFGASSILEYNTIESPLAQPRNLIFGHFLSALVGVSITKLFRLLPYADFDKIRWLAGALSVGTASVIMSITKTVHPPAGATALLCATEAAITELGWWFIALVLLGSMLMLSSALIINNLTRKFPVYWWTAADLESLKKQKCQEFDVEKSSPAVEEEGQERKKQEDRNPSASSETEVASSTQDGDDLKSSKPDQSGEAVRASKEHQILIDNDRVIIPDWLQADEWELQALRNMHKRLKHGPWSINHVQDSGYTKQS